MPESALTIRPANDADIEIITGFLRLMLEEMASVGGYEVSASRRAWDEQQATIGRKINSAEHCFFVAEVAAPDSVLAGMIETSIRYPPLILTPIPVLHVHAIFVARPYRRKGMGMALLSAALDWGQGRGCVAAELNVLADNPARFLYERSGFAVHQLEMRRLF